MGKTKLSTSRVLLLKIMFSLASLISCEAYANQVDALQTAMAYPGIVTTIPLIDKIEVVQAYHCPDCYDIRISGFDDTVSVKMVLRTLVNAQSHLEARLVDLQRSAP